MRSARPAPSSSARPRPPNSPPATVAQDPEPARPHAHAGGSSSGSSAAVGAGMVPAGARHPGRRLDPAPCELLWRGRLQAERRRDQPQRLARPFQPELPGRARRNAGRRLGGAPRHRRPGRRRSGLRRSCRRREFRASGQAGAPWPARNRRLERRQRRRTPGLCGREGSPRQGRRRTHRPRRRSRHRGRRTGHRRRAATDARHQRLGGPLAAQHLRRSRCQQAQRRRPQPVEDRRGDDTAPIWRADRADAPRLARPMPSSRTATTRSSRWALAARRRSASARPATRR